MQLLVYFPAAGYAADHHRRDTVLKMAGVIGMFASFMTALALYREDYTSLLVAFGIWGIFSAFQSPAMESLFEDSVPQGQRSLPFTLKHMAQQAAYILDPLFSIALLEKIGNTRNCVDVGCGGNGVVVDFFIFILMMNRFRLHRYFCEKQKHFLPRLFLQKAGSRKKVPKA